jgi:hypothetical protein
MVRKNCLGRLELSTKQRAAALCAVICGLLFAVTQTAAAQTRPSVTWIPYSPSFTVQQQGCGHVSGLTFQLTCSTPGHGSGFQRAERRYATYTGGSHKFEGTFKITSMGGSRISLKQTFHDPQGPFFLLAVENGGRLYSVEGGATIATGATVGTSVTVDTVQTVGSTLQVFINGSLKFTTSSPSGGFYDKIGAYATSTGNGPVTVQWSNLQFFHS